MSYGDFKVVVENIGNISVNWSLTVNGGNAGSLTITKFQNSGLPCYWTGGGCQQVYETSTSSGTFYMNDNGDDYLYFYITSDCTGVDAVATLYIEDDSGVVVDNTSYGYESTFIYYGDYLTYPFSYIPQGNVTITVTTSCL